MLRHLLSISSPPAGVCNPTRLCTLHSFRVSYFSTTCPSWDRQTSPTLSSQKMFGLKLDKVRTDEQADMQEMGKSFKLKVQLPAGGTKDFEVFSGCACLRACRHCTDSWLRVGRRTGRHFVAPPLLSRQTVAFLKTLVEKESGVPFSQVKLLVKGACRRAARLVAAGSCRSRGVQGHCKLQTNAASANPRPRWLLLQPRCRLHPAC